MQAGKYPLALAVGRCYTWSLLASVGAVGGPVKAGCGAGSAPGRTQPGRGEGGTGGKAGIHWTIELALELSR